MKYTDKFGNDIEIKEFLTGRDWVEIENASQKEQNAFISVMCERYLISFKGITEKPFDVLMDSNKDIFVEYRIKIISLLDEGKKKAIL